ncbi:MAG: hypothetical protein N2053_03715, partial [Chitinispirillaceae bacterium]|nr:hypothetical protein [Chitinispirillaceae bacterium]
LLPSILYAIWVRKDSKKEIVVILLLLIGISFIWFIPTYITTQEEGGPILLTMNFFLIFSKESSFFLGAPLKEAIRCGLRFILFSIAVLGPGGVVYLFLSLKKVSRYSLKLLLLGTFPSLLFGIFFHGPKPGYLATALGFFLVWSLKFALPSLKIVIIMFLFFINILFFVSIPSYSNWWSLQKERVTSQSKRDYSQKAKNLLYVSIGSSGMKELLYYRALHRKADSLYKSCNCVYDKILDHRVLYYFTSYVWHNQLNSSANSECCRNRIKLDKY